MVGVEYILKKAQELNRPVVICLGIGTNSGSHDGFSIFEEYLSEISNLVGVCLCIAAGNESQARHHTQGRISAVGEFQNIDISVTNESSVIYTTIWSGVADRLSVAVRSPTGELAARIPPKSAAITTTNLVFEQSSVQVVYFFPIEGSGGQLTAVRVNNAIPGIWTITVYGDLVLDGGFNAWLPLTGLSSPGIEFLAANPNYTITVPATTMGALCIGAYNIVDDSLYPSSSWGPTRRRRDGGRLRIDAAMGRGKRKRRIYEYLSNSGLLNSRLPPQSHRFLSQYPMGLRRIGFGADFQSYAGNPVADKRRHSSRSHAPAFGPGHFSRACFSFRLGAFGFNQAAFFSAAFFFCSFSCLTNFTCFPLLPLRLAIFVGFD